MLDKFKGLLFFLSIVVLSCDSKHVYDKYQSVPDSWHKDSIVSFEVSVPDTTTAYNLFINIRNTSDYKYNNLFLIAEINCPNGKVIKDTLEYKMAAANGELLGEGFSDIKENKLWFKGHDRPFVFDESGAYVINIQHAMRENGKIKGEEFLNGITDIGFRIETSEIN